MIKQLFWTFRVAHLTDFSIATAAHRYWPKIYNMVCFVLICIFLHLNVESVPLIYWTLLTFWPWKSRGWQAKSVEKSCLTGEDTEHILGDRFPENTFLRAQQAKGFLGKRDPFKYFLSYIIRWTTHTYMHTHAHTSPSVTSQVYPVTPPPPHTLMWPVNRHSFSPSLSHSLPCLVSVRSLLWSRYFFLLVLPSFHCVFPTGCSQSLNRVPGQTLYNHEPSMKGPGPTFRS